MSIESEVFKKVKPDYAKLKKYGFKKEKNIYSFSKSFYAGFTALIRVSETGFISGKVIDEAFDEEYFNIRLESNIGSYVASVKEAYIELLEDIKANCFEKSAFNGLQANRITDYILRQYGDKPEYLWQDDDTCVFRGKRNKKWYGVIMSVNYHKLDSDRSVMVDIINVKSDEYTICELSEHAGYYSGFHMNKKNWLSIVLDDSIADEIVFSLIDASHNYIDVTSSWIVPANPKYYDLFSHFAKSDVVEWKQSSDVKTGDIVYIYEGSPYSSIMFQCVVLEIDIPCDYMDENVTMKYVMRLKKLKAYKKDEISFERLKQLGIKAIRGPRRVSKEVEDKF